MRHPFNRELFHFAKLVASLRAAQRANGKGYKTPEGHNQASTLERGVDAEIARIIGQGIPASSTEAKRS